MLWVNYGTRGEQSPPSFDGRQLNLYSHALAINSVVKTLQGIIDFVLLVFCAKFRYFFVIIIIIIMTR